MISFISFLAGVAVGAFGRPYALKAYAAIKMLLAKKPAA
jgi:hypothetical protein